MNKIQAINPRWTKGRTCGFVMWHPWPIFPTPIAIGVLEYIGLTRVSNETWNSSLFLAVRVRPIIFKGRRTRARRCPLMEKPHNKKEGLMDMDVVSLCFSTRSYRHYWQRSPGPNNGCAPLRAGRKQCKLPRKQQKFSHQRRPNPYRSIVALALRPGAISHTATLLDSFPNDFKWSSSWGFPLRILWLLCIWLNYDASLTWIQALLG